MIVNIPVSTQPTTGGEPTQNETNPSLDKTSDKSSGSAAASVDPVDLTVEYGEALERCATDKDMDAVVMAFKPNYDAAKKPVQKVMDGLVAEHRRRIKDAA